VLTSLLNATEVYCVYLFFVQVFFFVFVVCVYSLFNGTVSNSDILE
jgi:hypothetical protein